MRKKLVVGNWKMNGALGTNGALLARVAALGAYPHADVVVCVPYPYLAQACQSLQGSGSRWGAQTLSEHAEGAYTGEVSGRMLAEFGCTHVIVGHSERRTLFGESDARVSAKAVRALAEGLVPIVCVGETLAQREAGETEAVVSRQLDAVIDAVGAAGLARSVLAYEPVWAIGTGRSATPAQAQAVHACLRAVAVRADADVGAGLRILYGGSVKGSNAAELFAEADVDGALVGGACLDAGQFGQIVEAAVA